MQKSVLLAIAAVLLTGAACAPAPQWYHPTKPADRWAVDKAECQSRASNQVNRDLDYQSDSVISQSQSTLQRQFSTFDAAKRRSKLYAQCMRDKGYTDKPPPKADGQGA